MEEVLIKRIMPNSLEAEQSVIGSMIMDKEAIVIAIEMLLQEDFYYQQYGLLFQSMVELYNAGEPVDLVTLQAKLKAMNVPEEISSLEFVRDLITAVPTSANVKSYAQIVKDKSVLRALIRVTEDIENKCYSGQGELEDILADTEKNIFHLLQNRGVREFVPIKEIVLNALEKIEQASKTQGNVTGIPTGFMDLDYKMSGLQNSDFILVAARPSMGKTALVLNIAQYVAFHENLATAIFSLEMSKEQLGQRLLAMESRVEMQKLKTGSLERNDWDRINMALDSLSKTNLHIDDTPGISVMEMKNKCRRLKSEKGLDLVIIDYLQLMKSEGKTDSRQQEISNLSRYLKLLAREMDCPVMVLSQLSRAPEQRQDHRPILSDLRESGSIEQDADMVMFLYRDDYYNKENSEKPGVCEVNLAKHRSGPTEVFDLTWVARYTKFSDKA